MSKSTSHTIVITVFVEIFRGLGGYTNRLKTLTLYFRPSIFWKQTGANAPPAPGSNKRIIARIPRGNRPRSGA